MKLYAVALVAMVCVPAGATTILDATDRTTVVLQTGDKLAFELLGASFGVNARAFGVSRYPTEVSFALISAPTTWQGSFWGVLASADGTVSVDFGIPLGFAGGFLSGANYLGPVSTLQGYLDLSPVLSQEIFGGGSAEITLRNDGPALQLGLEPYALRQNLYVSLSGGPLSVGAMRGSVSLETLSAAPEPYAGSLLFGGGVLLCAVSRLLARGAIRAKQGEKSGVCNLLTHSDTIYMADRNPPLEVPQIQPTEYQKLTE